MIDLSDKFEKIRSKTVIKFCMCNKRSIIPHLNYFYRLFKFRIIEVSISKFPLAQSA